MFASVCVCACVCVNALRLHLRIYACISLPLPDTADAYIPIPMRMHERMRICYTNMHPCTRGMLATSACKGMANGDGPPDRLPVGLLVITELYAGSSAECRQPSFGPAGTSCCAVCVVHQTLVPGPAAAEEAVAVPIVAEERVRVPRDVDRQGHIGIGRMEALERVCNMLLPDVPVGSLRARDVVGLDPELALAGRAGRRQLRAELKRRSRKRGAGCGAGGPESVSARTRCDGAHMEPSLSPVLQQRAADAASQT